MRFSAFHLLQSVGRDGKTNIAAKGVTGAGYDGHYFFGTPKNLRPAVFLHTQPDIARQLLQYRAHICQPLANVRVKWRIRAVHSIRGAPSPAQMFLLTSAGTAQYHINADIAYATALYTRDW